MVAVGGGGREGLDRFEAVGLEVALGEDGGGKKGDEEEAEEEEGEGAVGVGGGCAEEDKHCGGKEVDVVDRIGEFGNDVVLQLCGDDDLLKWMSQIGIRTCEVVGMARSFHWPVVLRPWEGVGVLYSKPS